MAVTSPRHDLALALATLSVPDATRRDVSAFWELARLEGVLPVAVQRLSAAMPVPPDVVREARDHEARALVDERDLRTVLDEFDRRHVRVLVIKGAALAHSLYERPGLRPRVDSDLLIARDDVERTHALFRDEGARYVPHVTGEYVMSQFHYVRTDRAGCEHAYDIHWRVVNPTPFASAFDFDVVWQRSRPLPALGATARGPSLPDALLIACVHRAAHHAAEGPLLWLLDVYLLAESMSAEDRSAFLGSARSGGLTAIASHALLEAASFFRGSSAVSIAAELREDADRTSEPTAAYLADRTRLQETVGDLRVLPWRARARFVRELAFPPAHYMRHVYAAGRPGPLPVLYARRLLTGIVRWARPRR